jgi:hypothetical protein
MTTNEYIATLIAYKQGNISLDDALELLVGELDLATVKYSYIYHVLKIKGYERI